MSWARRATGLTGAVLLVPLSGCSQDSGAVSLGSSRPSSVQGLPIPVQAQLISPPDGISKGFQAHLANCLLPPGVTLTALNAWYGKRLAQGRPWRDWTSCGELPLRPKNGLALGWKDDSSTLELATSEVGNGQVRVSILQQDVTGPGPVHVLSEQVPPYARDETLTEFSQESSVCSSAGHIDPSGVVLVR
jgi:hypothetical protein